METKSLNTFFGRRLAHTLPAWLYYQRNSFVLTELIIVRGAVRYVWVVSMSYSNVGMCVCMCEMKVYL